MSAQQFFRLRNPALIMALAAVFPVGSYAAGAANVDFASGAVTAVNVSGVQRPLSKGAEIGNGDTIRTGEGGRAQVRFSDGAMVSLQPDTEFRVDDYQFSGKTDGEEKGFFSLIKGGMRTITGLVGRINRNNYKITTSVATIGIRGTEFTAALGDGVLHINTGEGLIEVCNAAGCMLLASGESGIVNGGRAPNRTDSKPQLPPASPVGVSLPIYSMAENVAYLFTPTSPMPTVGTATYSTFISKSDVIEKTGAWAPGTLSSASVSVNFGTQSVSTSLQGQINAQSFSLSGSGSVSGNGLSSSISGFSGLCASGCSGSVSGTFYGTGAARVGIQYSFTDSTKNFSGAALLNKP